MPPRLKLEKLNVPFLPSSARTASGNGDWMKMPAGHRGVIIFLEITAASGTTPTLDIKLQMRDPVNNQAHDVPLVVFAQKTATGRDFLILYPGINHVATGTGRTISGVLPQEVRVNYAIAGTTPSFTFNMNADLIP